MKIELTDKEFEVLKILISNTNECESGCIIEEYQYKPFDCVNCPYFNKKNALIEKIMSYFEYECIWNRDTIDLEEFVNGRVAVWCDTEEKVNDFFNVLKEHEFIWGTGKPLGIETYYFMYENRTGYNFEDMGILYASTTYYRSQNYKIIKWEVI